MKWVIKAEKILDMINSEWNEDEKLKNEIFLSISRTKLWFKKLILWRWYALILFETARPGDCVNGKT